MTEVSCPQRSDEQIRGRRQVLVELSEDAVRALVAAGDRPHHAACNCEDYLPSERPCRFCAGMPVGADVFVQIRDSLRQALEAVSSPVQERPASPMPPEGALQGCPIHQGAFHGGEAEELRSGIEALIAYGDASTTALQELLDRVESHDSLGHLERIDLATGIARLLADESLSSGALRAKLQNLLDGIF